ncbi:MAG TPA: type II toxin-antitoxin system prevent-host-death family antitoxin [Rhodanobacteraceae bacterium]|nr:type II toxin-antitoxin system prevent-host-death family antitoxin [Rhodanobacteraceae bacterium]
MSNEMISLRDAKAKLSELADLAAEGVDVVIAKHGRPTARLTAARRKHKPVDLALLQNLTNAMPRQPEGAGNALRRLRGQARY